MLVCGVAGSLRRGSFNKALLRAAVGLAPAGMTIRIHDIADIPAYNGDVEAAGPPGPVLAFKEAIREADALLIATPEYNYGVPGVLKNAIDWASRPPVESPLRHKPTAIMGATAGMSGTARAQLQLRQAFVFTQTPVVPTSEVLVASAAEKFDTEGQLFDERTQAAVRRLLTALEEWAPRLAPAPTLRP
jgi:chromate reductase, NAD(P)H dehydrogenase (quinone)